MNELMKALIFTLDAVPPSEEASQASKAANPAIQAAQKRLTNLELDNLWEAISNIEHASELDNFTMGFRLGGQLTLEGLRPIYPTDQAAVSAPPCPPQ